MKSANQTIREEPLIRRVELERFSLTTSKPLDQVVEALNAAIGHPNIKEFWESAHRAKSMAELESIVQKSVGSAGLMLFLEFDHGSVVRKDTRSDAPRISRFLIGNPLIMMQMAKHVPDAGSYAPVTVLIHERPDGVHLSYDRMASFLEPYANAESLKVAKDLDEKSRRCLLPLLRKSRGIVALSVNIREESSGEKPMRKFMVQLGSNNCFSLL
jgi:uncharacterized protein (DUF302 family)